MVKLGAPKGDGNDAAGRIVLPQPRQGGAAQGAVPPWKVWWGGGMSELHILYKRFALS
eukprot:gene46215-42367_t